MTLMGGLAATKLFKKCLRRCGGVTIGMVRLMQHRLLFLLPLLNPVCMYESMTNDFLRYCVSCWITFHPLT